MAKAKVKRAFTNLPVSGKIQFSRDRVVDMTGNANFPTPSPALATVTTVTNDLETKHLAALGGGPMHTAARDAAELVWNDTMDKSAAYVEGIADGDVTILTSSGFTPTSTERQPRQLPEKPENLKMKRSDETGVIFFSCNPVPDAKSYIAILSADVAALDISTKGTQLMIKLNAASPAQPTLLILDISSHRKKVIRGLTPGTRIYGKIYCTNTAGRGPDSDAISIMVA